MVDLIYGREHFYQKREIIFRYYCAQMVEVVGYLQSKGISHRDIKVIIL